MNTDKAALGIEVAEYYIEDTIMTDVLDKRWLTVLKLQRQLQTMTPGCEQAENIEHAISLAVNSQRNEQNEKFFRYDLIRNAKFSRRRSQIRQNRLWKKISLLTLAWSEDAEPHGLFDLEAALRSMKSISDKNLSQCLNDMLQGKGASETAATCGISQRTAHRLRQKVRQLVQAYLTEQEVA